MKTSSSLNGYGRYVLKEQIESSSIKHQTMHLRANPYSEECRTIFSQTGVQQLSPSPAQHAITELWRTCLPGQLQLQPLSLRLPLPTFLVRSNPSANLRKPVTPTTQMPLEIRYLEISFLNSTVVH